LTFDIEWWWKFQEEISTQFGFSKIREDVATRLVSRLNFSKSSIRHFFKNKEIIIVGAGLTKSSKLPSSNLLVADGALRACLELDIVPEWVITDLDGYIPDILWASQNGSKTIVHAHGDNISRVNQYVDQINPSCITTTYPSHYSSCWGGFTDGDRSVMMCLSLGCKSIKLEGFNFDKVGSFSGDYSPQKLKKLKWAKKIINECQNRSFSTFY